MADTWKFPARAVVRHNKTGGTYKIARHALNEHDHTPVYVYECLTTNIVWVRPKTEMEDGRFERVVWRAK